MPKEAAVREPPYFFLGYAHTPEQAWVRKLFDDLCVEIQERTDLPLGSRIGFLDDLGIPIGGNWPEEVQQALATCRVFVPLYSPRYFSREECGREWYCFAQRILDHRARNPGGGAAIVPALWTPVAHAALPDVARQVQANHHLFGADYAEEGLYTLIKNRRYEDAYTTAVQELAKQIIRSAEECRLSPIHPADFGRIRNAFEPTHQNVPADRRLTIMVAAPTLDQLPAGRSQRGYGDLATDWNPWAGMSPTPLGSYAMDVARWHLFQPTLVSFQDQFETVCRSRAEDGLGLLLVDVWLVDVDELAEKLRFFDGLDLSWIATMVPVNRADHETRRRADQLWRRLNEVMGHRLSDPRVLASPSPNRVHSLEQFRADFPQVLERALQGYLEHAQAHPPDEQFPPRPLLTSGRGYDPGIQGPTMTSGGTP
jgi:FxsC-like protein